MQFDIITIFPHIFDSYFNESILKRAQKRALIKINIHNLRDFTSDKRKTVDDRPYGGGPGMIMKVEPIYKAIKKIKKAAISKRLKAKSLCILLTPQGKTFDQKMANRFLKFDQIILICGRYEGFDARISKFVDKEISIGNYVLSGGELPAMIIVEAVSRLVPGVLGHKHALDEETFSKDKDYIEYPQYTRPEIFVAEDGKKLKVPKILLSGDHNKIRKWRIEHLRRKNRKFDYR